MSDPRPVKTSWRSLFDLRPSDVLLAKFVLLPVVLAALTMWVIALLHG